MRKPIDQQPTPGAMLRLAREQAGLQQSEVARRSGHTQENLCQWEREAHRPRTDSFIDVANACGYRVVLVPVDGER